MGNTPLSPRGPGRAAASLLLTLGALASARAAAPASAQARLEDLAIAVAPAENRAVSYTNHRSAYFYTQTARNDHPEHAWFRGLNVAARRVFSDCTIALDGVPLDPAQATALVAPDQLVRRYPGGVEETLRLFDDRDLVEVSVHGAHGRVTLQLAGDQLRPEAPAEDIAWYVSTSPGNPPDVVGVRGEDGRFLVAVGPVRAAVAARLDEARTGAAGWTAERHARLAGLVNGGHYLWTDDPGLTLGLRWTTLTMAELVTQQRGEGIYAGLPWFNEYWGRDSFIALPGAALVTGQFETARAILLSFAKFQDLDPKSPFYGRVPNIVKVGELDYHTTDGTPRFLLSLLDYVRYSGDRSILRDLRPNLVASIEGSFAHWTDAAGYLVHADNETWMDARREPDHASYSPRANRANDIQALWCGQLRAGAELAGLLGEKALQDRWAQAADRVAANFTRDFLEAGTGRMADHLTAQGQPDYTLRPNLFFALGLLADRGAAARALRQAWESLVFPWGVATLDPRDPFFHPFHLAPGSYHKDEAYHNGTVWPWLNGIAMQRLIEAGQVEPAWALFRNMNDLALHRGVVGGLPETLDAYPHAGESQPRLTGTFLQAWSNSEQLRVWYQWFLGVRPDLLRGEVVLAPRLPAGLDAVEFAVRVGAGTLHARYGRGDGRRHYTYRLQGLGARLTLDLPSAAPRGFVLAAEERLVADEDPAGWRVRLQGRDGVTREEALLALSPGRRAEQAVLDAALAGLRFAAPQPLPASTRIHVPPGLPLEQ
jgi:hypothetical protein